MKSFIKVLDSSPIHSSGGFKLDSKLDSTDASDEASDEASDSGNGNGNGYDDGDDRNERRMTNTDIDTVQNRIDLDDGIKIEFLFFSVSDSFSEIGNNDVTSLSLSSSSSSSL